MKVVFVGGGAHRHLGIIRGALARKPVFDGGEIVLYDIAQPRAEAMGRMVMKSPEFADISCRVTWDASLEGALDGADAVSVVLMAGSARSFALGNLASQKRGFMSSDQLSPNGAFLALKGGPILMGIARKMERRCPDAWLIDFANPVAVLSAAVNNHTRIRCLGVCAGYQNHAWDLSRLMGRDELDHGFDVDVAGVNHLSFILGGTYRGQDLYKLLAKHLTPEWRPPRYQPWWSAVTKRNITYGLRRLVELFHKFGVVIFSTEGDGMAHLFYEQMMARNKTRLTRAGIEAGLKHGPKAKEEADRRFRALLDRDLDADFWANHWKTDFAFRREDHDIIVKILSALAGAGEEKIVASHPNRGAVDGFKDRTVLEYSQLLSRKRFRAAGRYTIPDAFHGTISALATHQTLLGDAIGTEDPKALYHALYAYPVKHNSRAAHALYRDLLAINRDEVPKAFQAARQYLH
jgi:alpha-galactosidase/6-phospho-beta-glucosidase family protein